MGRSLHIVLMQPNEEIKYLKSVKKMVGGESESFIGIYTTSTTADWD